MWQRNSSDHRVLQPTEDTAIVTYRVAITAMVGETEVKRTALATSVYALQRKTLAFGVPPADRALIAGSALEWPIDIGLDHCVRATRRSISRDTPGPLTDFGDS